MVNTKVIWEGSINSNEIFISNFDKIEFSASIINQSIFWDHHLKKYPNSYDGSLLLVKDIKLEEKLHGGLIIFFDIGIVKYSTLIAMKESKIHFNNNFGIIGTQCLIFSPCEQYILVGERAFDQYYASGLLTVPGGIIEQSDIEKNCSIALFRELNEEVELKYKNPKIIALLKDHTDYSYLILIKVILDQNFDPSDKFQGKDNEWENNKLYWIHLSDLKNINPQRLMEGLTYLRENN